MRIIAGSHKGHIIRPPKGLPIRPTTDRSKESLFQIIQNRYDLENCSVLDLFSGGGSISLEFASRGAKNITSVDLHPGCVKFLTSEAKKLEMEEIEVIKSDVMYFIRNAPQSYDVIFCDAPYAWKQYEEMIRLILDKNLLTPEGTLIVEHHSVTKLNHIPELLEQRAHGQNILSFFEPTTQINNDERE